MKLTSSLSLLSLLSRDLFWYSSCSLSYWALKSAWKHPVQNWISSFLCHHGLKDRNLGLTFYLSGQFTLMFLLCLPKSLLVVLRRGMEELFTHVVVVALPHPEVLIAVWNKEEYISINDSCVVTNSWNFSDVRLYLVWLCCIKQGFRWFVGEGQYRQEHPSRNVHIGIGQMIPFVYIKFR